MRLARTLAPALAFLILCAVLAGAAPAPPTGEMPKPQGTPGQRANSKTPFQSLVSAEKTFAALSVSQGMRTAFMANLAEDGVIFRPLATNGLKSWEARPASKGTLAWAPAYAEVAGSGDLGFTTGPWEFTPPADARSHEQAHGTFLSVWRRQSNGMWKLLADLGVSHDNPGQGLDSVAFVAGPAHSPQDTAAATTMSTRFLDTRMSGSVRSLGGDKAVRLWSASDLRYLHDGVRPQLGAAGIAALAAAVSHTRWVPQGGEMSRAGDLGFSYGVREDSAAVAGSPPDTTVYLHVWRRGSGNSWKIAAAVENPLHPKP